MRSLRSTPEHLPSTAIDQSAWRLYGRVFRVDLGDGFQTQKEAPRGASDYIVQREMLKGEHPPPQANFGVRHDAP